MNAIFLESLVDCKFSCSQFSVQHIMHVKPVAFPTGILKGFLKNSDAVCKIPTGIVEYAICKKNFANGIVILQKFLKNFDRNSDRILIEKAAGFEDLCRLDFFCQHQRRVFSICM